MKSAIDKLVYKNQTEFIEQLHALNEQDEAISEESKLIIKILTSLGKDATEDQLELLQEVQKNLNIHRILLKDLAALFDYPPYPDLKTFSKQLQKNSLQLQPYIDAFDKDPKAGRALILNKREGLAKVTKHILVEQFETSELSRVVASVQNLGDGANLSSSKQLELVQQVVYINGVGKEFPLKINEKTYKDLTGLSRVELRGLSDLLVEQVNDPLLGTQGRIKAQLNLLAVMREQYFRCSGVFLNTTQLVVLLLSLNNLGHNSFVELTIDDGKKDIKAILAAFQWVFSQGVKEKSGENTELLVKEFKEHDAKDFFVFLGIPLKELNANATEESSKAGIMKLELVGLSKKMDGELAYRVPSHSKKTQHEQSSAQDTVQVGNENKGDINQGKAVEQYYVQSMTTTQRVVLSQFDEWQEFLHLINPKAKWKQLDSELFLIKQDLIKKLDQQWTQILKATDPEQVFPNPYVRRLANKKLDTKTLDKALNDYARAVNGLWKSTRNELKIRTKNKISPGSVNALRFKYLQQVELKEQLKLNKLATRENEKITRHEKNKTNRLVESALNVHGAMLKYSDADVESYRKPYIEYQMKLLVNDIYVQINQSSLPSHLKKELVDQMSQAESLIDLELILIDYNQKWLSNGNPTEKYRMQPIINELLRVHKLSGTASNVELKTLTEIYLDNVANDIVQNLEHTLSWAKKENRGLGYLIERTAVKEAAADLLSAVEGVKCSTDPLMRQVALKNLFIKLSRHQAQLENIWIFSFGHKNTRDLINQTLSTLNELTVIGSGKDELDLDFINKCKEEAHSEVLKQKFRIVLKELEDRNSPWLKVNKEWQGIMQKLSVIQGENPSFYAIAEMYHFVALSSKELSQTKSNIIDPLIHLRGTLRRFWNDVSQKHQDLLCESSHFDHKESQFKKDLDGINGFDANTVQLVVGSNGSREYYDLIIKGSGSIPLFDKFTRYNSPVAAMVSDRDHLSNQLKLSKSQSVSLEKLYKEQFALLKKGEGQKVQVSLFPEKQRENVRKTLALQEWNAGKIPENIVDFPPDLQNYFFDREVSKSLNMAKFFDKDFVNSPEIHQMFEQIATLKDQKLIADFTELYKKIHPVHVETSKSWWSPKTWVSSIASLITSSFTVVETEEDWRYQFAEISGRAQSCLTDLLSSNINKQIEVLNTELQTMQVDADKDVQSINEQIQFIDRKIADEEKKRGVLVQRFHSIGQLYDFEVKLKEYKALNPKVAPKVADVEYVVHEDENELDLDEFLGPDEEDSISEEEKPGLKAR